MGDLSAHFSTFEFACPCCAACDLDPGLVLMLEKIRARLGGAIMHITRGGGYRCAEFNRRIRTCVVKSIAGHKHGDFHGLACPICGGAGEQRSARHSRHMMGTEADVVVDGVSPDAVADMAELLGVRNVGRYNFFTHLGIGGKPVGLARWDKRTKRGVTQ